MTNLSWLGLARLCGYDNGVDDDDVDDDGVHSVDVFDDVHNVDDVDDVDDARDVDDGGFWGHGQDNAVAVGLGAVGACCWLLMLMLVMMLLIPP